MLFVRWVESPSWMCRRLFASSRSSSAYAYMLSAPSRASWNRGDVGAATGVSLTVTFSVCQSMRLISVAWRLSV